MFRLLKLPDFLDIDVTRQARAIYRAAQFGIALVTLFSVGFLLRTKIPLTTVVLTLLCNGGLLLVMGLVRRGKVMLAWLLFALVGWTCITYIVVFVHGGISSPVVGFYILITVLCALINGRAGYIFAGLGLTTIIMVMAAEENGLMLAPIVDLNFYWKSLWYMNLFLMTSVLVHSISNTIQWVFLQSGNRQRELTAKNLELEEIRHTLEERVKQRTQEILREKHFFEAVVMHNPVAIAVLNLDGCVTAVNPAFERMFGYSNAEMFGVNLDHLVADPACLEEPFYHTRRMCQGEPIFEEGRRRRKDGSLLWVEVRGVPVSVGDVQIGLLAIYYDLTEQKRVHEELRASEAQYRALFENVMDGVFRSTPDGRFLTVNPAMVHMLGFSSVEELLACDIPADIYVTPGERKWVLERLHNEGVIRNAELTFKRKDGELIHALENAFVVRDAQGEVLYYEGTLTDITERKHAEECLRFMATHDTLTGLPNRTYFYECLGQRIARLQPGQRLAVMFTDLDGFKQVNDQFGHAHGDVLLQRVGALFQAALRSGDMVARMGGDEFCFFFDPIQGTKQALELAARIQSALVHPICLDNQEVMVSSSIGISLYPEDGQDAETLLK